MIPIPLDAEDPKKVTYISASLKRLLMERLIKFLQERNDVFAWTADNMSGFDPQLITHKINVDPMRKTIKKKRRSVAPKRQEAIK